MGFSVQGIFMQINFYLDILIDFVHLSLNNFEILNYYVLFLYFTGLF